MNIKNKIIFILSFFVYINTANAISYPKSAGFSNRIKVVNYNPSNETLLNVKVGTVSLIQFQKGEFVIDKDDSSGIGMGNTLAWDLGVRGNNIFLKPKINNPETNLIITTNKNRTYSFLLKPSKYPTWILRFNYLKTKKEKLKEQQLAIYKKERNKILNLTPCSNGKRNFTYYKWGDNNLAPDTVWDDGQFTCFSFSKNTELPLIYKVNHDKTESLLNTYIKNNITIVHSVNKEYRIRLGKEVLGIETPKLKIKNFSTSNTSIDHYKRVIKNDRQ